MSYSYLSAIDRSRLEELPFAALLPEALPGGWSYAFSSEFCDEEDEECSVEITFSGPNAAKLMVASTSGGVGDVIFESEEVDSKTIENPVMGQIYLYSSGDEDAEILSDWFPEDGEQGTDGEQGAYYRLRGVNIGEPDLSSLIRGLNFF